MVRLLEKRKRTISLLSTFAIATLGLHAFTILLFVLQGLTIRKLSLQKNPTFVQLVNGRSVTVPNDLDRQTEDIRQFVSKTMTAMFDWSGTLPAQTIEQVTNPTTDPGINITTPQGGARVTTSSWIASFALSEDFRKGFLAQIAQMTPPEVFSNNSNQAISAQLVVKRVYPPIPIAPGKWEVGMVANLIQKRRSEDKKIIIPFNKDFLVSAVDTFVYPLTDAASDLQKAIYSVRNQKLEIYEVRNLCLLDKYEKPNSDEHFSICENPNYSGSFTAPANQPTP